MNSENVRKLLAELEAELKRQGESNWIRGVAEVRQLLDEEDGASRARTAYAAMNQGANSFNDYNIWLADFEKRRQANAALDRIRDLLWQEFDLS